nr:hypothetical protein [uncultured Desulfuromusa sp.]
MLLPPLILLMTALVALLIGPVALGFEDFLPVSRTTTQDLGRHIIWQIRMPRICGAMLGGAGFSVGRDGAANNSSQPPRLSINPWYFTGSGFWCRLRGDYSGASGR